MSRTVKRTISMTVVLLLIVGMGGLYFWQTRTEAAEEELPAPPPVAALNLIQRQEADVELVVFYENGERTVLRSLSPIDGVRPWVMLDTPYSLNQARTREKAQSSWLLNASSVAHEDASGLDLAQFGLDPPAIIMEVRFTDGSTHTVRLGTQTADMRHHFVMIDHDPAMYLLSNTFAQRMLLGVEDMLEVGMLFEAEFTTYLRIAQRGRPTIEFGPGDEDDASEPIPGMPAHHVFLTMLEPYPGMELNHFNMSDLIFEPLSTLQMGPVVELHPTNLSDFGLDDPILEIEYHSWLGDTHLLFGNIFEYQGIEVIYVKFADRPHVFKTAFQMVSPLFDLHTFSLIQRFFALVDIRDVERITIDSPTPAHNFDMVVNHPPEEGSSAIEPTINGVPIEEREFRRAYTLVISISSDAETTPFMPQGTPYLTITFHRIENPNTEVRLFDYNPNFFAASLDGAEVWSITNRRAVDLMLAHFSEMVS